MPGTGAGETNEGGGVGRERTGPSHSESAGGARLAPGAGHGAECRACCPEQRGSGVAILGGEEPGPLCVSCWCEQARERGTACFWPGEAFRTRALGWAASGGVPEPRLALATTRTGEVWWSLSWPGLFILLRFGSRQWQVIRVTSLHAEHDVTSTVVCCDNLPRCPLPSYCGLCVLGSCTDSLQTCRAVSLQRVRETDIHTVDTSVRYLREVLFWCCVLRPFNSQGRFVVFMGCTFQFTFIRKKKLIGFVYSQYCFVILPEHDRLVLSRRLSSKNRFTV